MSRWPLLGMALLPLACGAQAGSQAAAAAVTVATHVAAAAINRAATGECWGMCDPGYGCDEASGRCVPIAELDDPSGSGGEAPENAGCIVEDDGVEICPDDPEPPFDPLEHVEEDDTRLLESPPPPPPDGLEAVDRPGPDPLESDAPQP